MLVGFSFPSFVRECTIYFSVQVQNLEEQKLNSYGSPKEIYTFTKKRSVRI